MSIQIPSAVGGLRKSAKRKRASSKVGVAGASGTPSRTVGDKPLKYRRYNTPDFELPMPSKKTEPLSCALDHGLASVPACGREPASGADETKKPKVTPEQAKANLAIMNKVLLLNGIHEGEELSDWFAHAAAEADGVNLPLGYGECNGTHGVGGTCTLM